MVEYTIIIEKAEGNYSAYCPDLPGCIATGFTPEETIQRMKEAIKFHLEGLKKEKIAIPEPSTKAVSIGIAVNQWIRKCFAKSKLTGFAEAGKIKIGRQKHWKINIGEGLPCIWNREPSSVPNKLFGRNYDAG